MGKIDKKFIKTSIEKYKETLVEIEFFKQTNQADFPCGTLVKKKSLKKTKSGKTYTYDAYYLEITTYVNKKKFRKYKYVRKADLNRIRKLINERNTYKRKLRELNANYKPWERKINNYSNKNLLDKEILDRQTQEKVFFKIKAESNRISKYNENIKNTNYKVLTYANDFVRSKNEALLADCFLAEQIEYIYENEIVLKPKFANAQPLRFKPDFTILTDSGIVYIELLGKMDEQTYIDSWQRRKTEFAINNIHMGENLVCFSCSSSQEINCNILKNTIRELKQGVIPRNTVDVSICR